MTNEKEIVLFETEDKKITFLVEVKDETVWINVSQMAQLFNREESNIRRHVLNVFKENEVDENNKLFSLAGKLAEPSIWYRHIKEKFFEARGYELEGEMTIIGECVSIDNHVSSICHL